MKDETLADLALSPPKKQADLARVRGLSGAWAGNDIGGRLMAALADAVPTPASEMPWRDDRDRKSNTLNSSHYCACRQPSSACKKTTITHTHILHRLLLQ